MKSFSNKTSKMMTRYLAIITALFGVCCAIPTSNVYASCIPNVNCNNISQVPTSQIVISRDSLSPSSQINILIHAPDFNSNSYALDTIGVDGSRVTISTRESSIPYKLVETGPNTGDFAGYVILSSTTSVCSPVCGPTDGFLAAGGDDAINVSFTYADGHTISASSSDQIPVQTNHGAIPEFSYAGFVLLVSMVSLIMIFRMNLIL
ncbi:MAG: hypothetical protein KGH86_06515 [Thaumarchaeota archaeon]|nr:hypothetical protein [Nitrososphaerota archaeon]